MSLDKTPALKSFLSTYIADADQEQDAETFARFLSTSSGAQAAQVVAELKRAIDSSAWSIEDLGVISNRWFGDADEAKAWLSDVASALSSGGDSANAGGAVVVKDSNGAVLSEGDSVMVIKDLKVKGGSSDLKRGTLVKKIHLIDDAENVECRVDGSTLVLKTCFLKKA